MFENEMLMTSVETFHYTLSINVGLIFTYNIFKTNRGLFLTEKEVEIILPHQYDFAFMIPWIKAFCIIAFMITIIVYTVRFIRLIQVKVVGVYKSHDFNLFYPSDLVSIIQIGSGVIILIYWFILF